MVDTGFIPVGYLSGIGITEPLVIYMFSCGRYCQFFEVYQFTLVPVKCESPNCSTTLSTIGIVVHLILAILETKILIFTKIL